MNDGINNNNLKKICWTHIRLSRGYMNCDFWTTETKFNKIDNDNNNWSISTCSAGIKMKKTLSLNQQMVA